MQSQHNDITVVSVNNLQLRLYTYKYLTEIKI